MSKTPLFVLIALWGCAPASEIDTREEAWAAPAFIPGEHFEQQARFEGIVDGVALADDELGAVGMAGMICGLDTRAGVITTDVDQSSGDEVVVDAMPTPEGTQFAAIDRDQITVALFGEGAPRIVHESHLGNDLEFAALTHAGPVVVSSVNGCLVTRWVKGVRRSVAVPGACQGLDADVEGLAFVATDVGTYAVDTDFQATQIGPAGDLLAYSPLTKELVIRNGDELRVFHERDEVYAIPVDDPVGVVFLGDELVVAESERLLRYVEGQQVAAADTSRTIQQLVASTDDQLLGVVTRRAVHLLSPLD